MDIDATLEAATSDFFWVPPDVEVVERPAITYTHADREAGNFNRVTRVRPEREESAGLVAEVRAAHAGSESKWSLNPMGDTPELRSALEAAGYETGHLHHAYAIRASEYSRTVPEDVEVRQVGTLDDLRTLYAIMGEVFDRGRGLSEEDLAGELEDCTGPERRVARFVACRHGEAAGVGGLTFFDALGFGLIWAGGVREAHRGQGVYTSLLRARAEVAARRGLDWLGLYAREGTSAPIVEAHAFERYGHMQYYEQDLRG